MSIKNQMQIDNLTLTWKLLSLQKKEISRLFVKAYRNNPKCEALLQGKHVE
jgi:hypothetical protein